MAVDPAAAQHLATALLNGAVAVLTGASLTRLRLARDGSGWSAARRRPVRRAAIAGAVVALAVDPALLWLVSAATAEVPLFEAGAATWTMLASTHLGLAWTIGMAGLAAAAACTIARDDGSPGPTLLALVSLTVFWYARSMASHAAAEGDFSLPLLADWLHQGLTSVWVGSVIVAGAIMLRSSGDMGPDDRHARAAYVRSLSGAATLALAGIFVTGLYAAWRQLGGLANLLGNPYGNTLVAKLLLVGAAVALGGFNRFVTMPPWLAQESHGRAADERRPALFRRILVLEALVLLTVVLLAAWLASTPPPGESL